MSKRIISLMQIVQDLESRYGKSDPDVQKLQIDLDALLALRESYKQKRKATLPFGRGFQEDPNGNEFGERLY
jgi:hypothetical protein